MPKMLRAAAAIFLCLLPSQVNGLLTADAKCLSGYEWTFSSIGQSPCDVAAELASVCAGGQFNLDPLPPGYSYVGPTTANANACRCSSVYYSMLSACAYCQGRDYVAWSAYSANCSTVFVTVYNQRIPDGVKVPAYAYQNVSSQDRFDVTVAQSVKGVESSASTPITKTSSYSPTATGNSNKTPVIVGAVVGGIAGLGILGALITVMLLMYRRSKRNKKAQNYASNILQSPKMPMTPNTIAPLIPASTSSPPPPSGSPGVSGKIYDPNDPTTFPSNYPHMYDPYGQQMPAVHQTSPPQYTGSSIHNAAPQQMSQHTGGHSYYSGAPEL